MFDVDTSCVVISADYRFAPEHSYPAAVDDCFDALRFVVREGPGKLGIDRSYVMLAGISTFVYSFRLLPPFE